MIFLIIYLLGYFTTLYGLHRFKKFLGIDHYDGPHDGYDDYDDWTSNSEAYAAWSLAWPLLWAILVITGVWYALCTISSWMQDRA